MQGERSTLTMNYEPYRKKSDIHYSRKIWHFAGVMFMVILYHNFSRPISLQLATFGLVATLLIELLRQNFAPFNKVVVNVFYPLMRSHEKNSLTGTTYMLAGVTIIIYLFPRNVVTLALFFLATADPLASYFGIKFGKDRLLGEKTLQGTLAAFAICTVIAFVFFYSRSLMVDRLVISSLLAGIIGAVSELLPVGKLDDNLTFPVISSSLLLVLFYLFGGL